MRPTCTKCPKSARQESRRIGFVGFNGVEWRPYCELHLKDLIARYPLEIRPIKV